LYRLQKFSKTYGDPYCQIITNIICEQGLIGYGGIIWYLMSLNQLVK